MCKNVVQQLVVLFNITCTLYEDSKFPSVCVIVSVVTGYSFPVRINITFTEIIAPQWLVLALLGLCVWTLYMFDCAMKRILHIVCYNCLKCVFITVERVELERQFVPSSSWTILPKCLEEAQVYRLSVFLHHYTCALIFTLRLSSCV